MGQLGRGKMEDDLGRLGVTKERSSEILLSRNSATPLLLGDNGFFCQSYFAVSHIVPFPQHSAQTTSPEEAELLLVATPVSAKPRKGMHERGRHRFLFDTENIGPHKPLF